MQQFSFGAIVGFMIALFVGFANTVPSATAQFVREHEGESTVRGFHGSNPLSSGVKRSYQSDSEAKAEFDRILAAVGLAYIADRIELRASAETNNAAAGIDKKGGRFIFYNATFMQKLREKTADQWSLLSILAHELGHHVAFHTELTGNDHKYELEADYFSGFVLRRLGGTLVQSHGAIEAISPKEATKSHPGLAQRLQVITLGWTDGGSAGAPRGLNAPIGVQKNGADPKSAPPPSPSSTATERPRVASLAADPALYNNLQDALGVPLRRSRRDTAGKARFSKSLDTMIADLEQMRTLVRTNDQDLPLSVTKQSVVRAVSAMVAADRVDEALAILKETRRNLLAGREN